MESVKIEYTHTVKTCIDDIANYLHHVDVEVKPVITDILEQFEKQVSQFPLGCQVCPELIKIGVAKYRECNTAGGYRVLYSVDGSTITAHAILSHRQDVKQLLFKRLIQA
ncbi:MULTISPECIES: type II toxin-antitoxin system RelE/ParE family toxin [Citrobacter]|jgi:plasmid stabilization system protein ParE|uniref:type II toxin-antitoxin system RelE/ParE family toxin n=1 Tax=Citrobacter TaxID=544 RepID=UPI0006697E99|nr:MULTISPECIES: type II toxin-antitoxin system RelE/ParE family toxin [Citrobacter]MBA7873458.1 type II toxin-antitoxin system RelE/ParE family toxin [Citrobacter sp. RHBSTW-00827]MBA7939236.1 type II toxin-antitoxin system RelE/ParE family toxin [Citrobacter sp. RHBSTW-00509]MBJ8896249.1 type II toxin-antitoxin system RelE/ParE family toxin [Citrobacter braakii]MCZ5392780.1 type II toxin-antitoxin system RelE/ParE family toxin [Citrobacter braakii]MDE9581323.1 type II toxin-antitoxin system 